MKEGRGVLELRAAGNGAQIFMVWSPDWMDVAEIRALPQDLLTLCQRVAALRQSILIGRQVSGNRGWTCVTVRSGWGPDWPKVLPTAEANGWIDHLRLGQVGVSLLSVVHEVMGLVVWGMLNKQIASELGISEVTVKITAAWSCTR